MRGVALCLLLAASGCGDDSNSNSHDLSTGADLSQTGVGNDLAQANDDAGTPKKHVIMFVWDGLRPDSITATDTPNLHALQAAGVNFADNHATYPTFTMMNAGSLATGGFPGSTGFYGNTLYAPGATGNNAVGNAADFVDPVFTEDSQILQDLDTFYSNKLLLVGSLFQAAQAAGLTTCAVGKRGPAFLQDYKKGGLILDEDMAWPLGFAKELQTAGFALPANTPHAYGAGAITLAGSNGSPTSATPAVVRLTDGQTSDPTVGTTSRYNPPNTYLMNTFLFYVLPQKDPQLSVIWLRNPDTTEHDYGPGSAAYKDALHTQDMLLGQLLQQLRNLHIDTTTDVIIMSDHAHSTVSGPPTLFPLRDITAGAVVNSAVDAAAGWSVSGEVRLADLLARGGFTAYDGFNCTDAPVMNGIKDNAGTGTPVYQEFANSVPPAFGAACATGAPAKYTTGNFIVPATLPAHALVIAANGGSDYIYVPDHDTTTVQNVVKFLQQREEIGAIFIDKDRYGDLAGTIPLAKIRVANTAGRHPDIVLSYDWDDTAMVQGLPGIEYDGTRFNNRGMHGSFSPIDVHNVLLASGPDFATGMMDALPSGNVDVAPTVAQLFGLSLPMADGRPLLEALVAGGATMGDYTVTPSTVAPTANATGLVMQLPTDPNDTAASVDATKTAYSITLKLKTLTRGSATWTYFDSAKAMRQ